MSKKNRATPHGTGRPRISGGPAARSLPAKVTMPRLARVHPRSRLFELLDCAFESSAVWVEAVPGAGKTTLAASWLHARGRPCLWYQVDASDHDVATLFHYLGLAIGPLPHLTPEYLPGLELFARRYFEEAFRRVPEGAVLVFDNVQDAGADAAFNDVLRIAIECVPGHAKVMCLSRGAPPASLARLRANGVLALLESDAVRLTLNEAHEIAQLRGTQDAARTTAIYEQTLGWTAGLVLMLEGASDASVPLDMADPGALFSYFASEVLQRLDIATRDVLLQSSILPKMRASDVEALTGNDSAGALLADLARRNYFTYRLSPRAPVYEYHPLFREFLRTQLNLAMKPAQRMSLQSTAGQLMDAAGFIEDAANLWIAAADHAALKPHILKHAAQLISEGRSHVIEAWLAALPSDQSQSEPWLQYWSGICRLAFAPAQARPLLMTALQLFERSGDFSGAYEAWASIVDSIVYEWSDFEPLDRWLEKFSELQKAQPRVEPAAVDGHVAASVFNALVWRRPNDPDLPRWAGRVKQLAIESTDVRFRIVAGNNLALYYLWMGTFASATLIVETLRPALRTARADPLVRLTWHVMEAMQAWFVADARACIAAVESGSQLADECGVHLHDLYLYAQAVYCGLSLDEPAIAGRYLKRMAGIGTPRRTDHSLLQYQRAAAAWSRGDFAVAVEHGEAAAGMAVATGAPLLDGFCRIELALFLFSAGRHDEAEIALDRGRMASGGMNFLMYLECLYRAWFLLEQDRRTEAVMPLRAALGMAAEQGYVNAPHWNATMMARLCALALGNEIEPDYVRSLIARRTLAPPEEMPVATDWPWPARIYTLGRLRFEVAGAVPAGARKSPRKLLELLALLVASGEAGVTAERAIEALWSEFDGTKSREALRVMLYRLRRLLGGEERVVTTEGYIALDPTHCWVDAWAFEHALDTQRDRNDASFERALALYRGPFVDDDNPAPWALAYRQRLHDRYVQAVLEAGARLQREQQFERALACYQRGLQHAGLVESFYQRVLACCLNLGRRAEGLAAYERCRLQLREALGVSPAEQTEKLRVALLTASS